MKKTVLLLWLTVMGLFLICSPSFGDGVAGNGKGCNGNRNPGTQRVMDAETKKKYDQFMAETVDLRKELEEKAAEYQTLVASGNPDPTKAAMLTEQYFQLRDFLTQKAVQAGIVQQRRGCNGCNGGCNGKQGGVACGLPAGKTQKVQQTN